MANEQPKFQIIKETIVAKTRKLSADWTIEEMQDITNFPSRRKKPETPEEEADEIIHRLKHRQEKFSIEEELMGILGSEIQKEIDKEILEQMMKSAGKGRKK
jgi:hypothetical protein